MAEPDAVEVYSKQRKHELVYLRERAREGLDKARHQFFTNPTNKQARKTLVTFIACSEIADAFCAAWDIP